MSARLLRTSATGLLAAAVCGLGLVAFAQMEISGRVLDVEGTLRELGAKIVDREIRIALAADVLFDFDKHDLKAAAVPTLAKVGEVLEAHAGSSVVIEGHTDGRGEGAYNQRLSERRAAAVRDWLVKNARQPRSRFTTRGFGMTRPIAPNRKADGSDDPNGRERNRRVEIVVTTS